MSLIVLYPLGNFMSSFLRNVFLGGWLDSLFAKILVVDLRGVKFRPPEPRLKVEFLACTCNPSAREAGTAGFLGIATLPVH